MGRYLATLCVLVSFNVAAEAGDPALEAAVAEGQGYKYRKSRSGDSPRCIPSPGPGQPWLGR